MKILIDNYLFNKVLEYIKLSIKHEKKIRDNNYFLYANAMLETSPAVSKL